MPIIIYNKMIKRKINIRIFAVFLCLLSAGRLSALDREIISGREDGWSGLTVREGITVVRGKFGLDDIILKDAEYSPDSSTDLLLHFNNKAEGDAAGRYNFKGANSVVSDSTYVLGGGSFAFLDLPNGEKVIPGNDALLSPGSKWGDFSIEFWIYPATMNDGESILSWSGAGWRNGKLFLQSIQCSFRKRRLVWDFKNIFSSPEKNKNLIELRGLTGLIPKQWSHHLLRFNSTNGLIEYQVDGRLEAVFYATVTGNENSTVLIPHIGNAAGGVLYIAGGYTGLIDEMRITRKFVTTPNLKRYYKRAGVGASRVFDLGYTGTTLKRIDVLYKNPSDSGVYFYYKVSDVLTNRMSLNGSWLQFVPGEEFKNTIKGRYVQIRMELFPDGTQMYSPAVSEIHIIYEPDLPPAPPSDFNAVAGDGEITLYWEAVNEQDVAGYLVYYGESPGNYMGTGAEEGDSPIDAGKVTKFTVSGLKNRKLYSFVVVAYDSSVPPHRSIFSSEITIRPSGIKK